MSDLDLAAFKDAIADIAAHRHPSGYDLYCHNLQSWMGERAHLLVAEIERLKSQRDKVFALLEDVECSNCGHAVKLHDASPAGECTEDHMKTRPCGCDWTHPLVDDIRAIYAEDGAR